MPINPEEIQALIFDYGNTIIEFSHKQVETLNQSLRLLLEELYGPCDYDRFCEIRRHQIIAPYATEEFIENDRKGICIELVRELYGITPNDTQVRAMQENKHNAFIRTVELPDYIPRVLSSLQQHYKLAFISNYPCRSTITGSLEKLGINKFFEVIVVSGELGIVKPHPDIFRVCVEKLNLPPEKCIYVGDNWLADIQGAKRFGMQAVHTVQYVSYENFQPFPGDYQPDAVITHLNHLIRLLVL